MLKKPITPNSKIKNSLRRLWLQSRERAAALKAAAYSCQECGAKQSKRKNHEQKIEVHHKNGIDNWNKVIKTIRKYLLPSNIKNLEVLCPICHKKKHNSE